MDVPCASRLVFVADRCHFDGCSDRISYEITSVFDHLYGIAACKKHYDAHKESLHTTVRDGMHDYLPRSAVSGCDDVTLSILRSSGRIEHGWTIVQPGDFQSCRASFRLSCDEDPEIEVGFVNISQNLVKYLCATTVLAHNPGWTPVYMPSKDPYLSPEYVSIWKKAWEKFYAH